MDELDKARIRKEFLIEVGYTIRKNRIKNRISQEDLAAYLGVDRSSISKYENGKMDMPVSNLPLISQHCDFSITEFVKKKDTDLLMDVLDKSIYRGYPLAHKDVVQFPATQAKPKKRNAYTREEVAEYLMLEENRLKREALSITADILPLAKEDFSGRLDHILKATVDFVLYDVDSAKNKKLQGYLKNVSDNI